ncbi:MAG: DNA cytosine methyltransferase [Rhodocyclaceae bacterium]|nr:DNA cytosine methyltransferase [Rhodocyclaceae bacterium]MCA3116399.1 DNA cytosine methyltransferase [Rhodocyclaceae bacterium]
MIRPHELIVDSFAGGGGASLGISWALDRSPDIAINHDAEAIAMHTVNHPGTLHFCEDVWKVDPVAVTGGRPVGLMWLSPDCKHFSKAKGGKPVEKKIRGLANIAVHWARTVRPRVIILENVEEFADWGPLTAEGRPCDLRRGLSFRQFVGRLRARGYAVDWRQLRACDYGAPTSRKRLFLVARCDGLPIAWPAPTHGRGLQDYRTAADCIDWSRPCPSIFERSKPLAEATLRRVARGIQRYVIESAEPFIVHFAHGEGKPGGAQRWGSGAHSIAEPFPTLTSKAEHMLAVPTLINIGYGERPGQALRVPGLHKPLGTVVGETKHALVAAFLAKHYGGVTGQVMPAPIGTVTAVDHHSLVASTLVKMRNHSNGADVRAPLDTVSAGGTHFAEVRAFLIKFYQSGGQWASPGDPMHTITARDRMGLVTVHGEDYAIADIGLRMLQPRELYCAQGFPDDYKIDVDAEGNAVTKAAQVRMCGNSVCPPVAAAMVAAQFGKGEVQSDLFSQAA